MKLTRGVPELSVGTGVGALSEVELISNVHGAVEENPKSMGDVVLAMFRTWGRTVRLAAHLDFVTRTVRFAKLIVDGSGVATWNLETADSEASPVSFNAFGLMERGGGIAGPVSEFQIERYAPGVGSEVLVSRPALQVVGGSTYGLDDSQIVTNYGPLAGILLAAAPRGNLGTILNDLERLSVSDDAAPVVRFREAIVTQADVIVNQTLGGMSTDAQTMKAASIYVFGDAAPVETGLPSKLFGAADFDASLLADIFAHGKAVIGDPVDLTPEEEEFEEIPFVQ